MITGTGSSVAFVLIAVSIIALAEMAIRMMEDVVAYNGMVLYMDKQTVDKPAGGIDRPDAELPYGSFVMVPSVYSEDHVITECNKLVGYIGRDNMKKIKVENEPVESNGI